MNGRIPDMNFDVTLLLLPVVEFSALYLNYFSLLSSIFKSLDSYYDSFKFSTV